MYIVEDYSFGIIKVDGQKYSRDVIISKTQIKPNWWRKEGHKLHKEDLDFVFNHNPEVLVIGTGANNRMKVPEQLRAELRTKNIEVIVKNTTDAVEIYNDLVEKREGVFGAFHLTC